MQAKEGDDFKHEDPLTRWDMAREETKTAQNFQVDGSIDIYALPPLCNYVIYFNSVTQFFHILKESFRFKSPFLP
jgi:hypothetical protein